MDESKKNKYLKANFLCQYVFFHPPVAVQPKKSVHEKITYLLEKIWLYRLIILRMSLLLAILSENLNGNST